MLLYLLLHWLSFISIDFLLLTPNIFASTVFRHLSAVALISRIISFRGYENDYRGDSHELPSRQYQSLVPFHVNNKVKIALNDCIINGHMYIKVGLKTNLSKWCVKKKLYTGKTTSLWGKINIQIGWARN